MFNCQLFNRRIVYSAIFFICLTNSIRSVAEEIPSFRLILTDGLNGIHDGSRAFLNSLLFYTSPIAGMQPPFVIDGISQSVYTYQGSFFLFDGCEEADRQPLLQSPVVRTGQSAGITGSAFIGIGESNGSFELRDIQWTDELRRQLGAELHQMKWESKKIDHCEVYAIAQRTSGVHWPTDKQALRQIPAVWARSGTERALFFAVPIAATSYVFQTVDKLMTSNSKLPSYFADLGNAVMDVAYPRKEMIPEMQRLLSVYKPVFLGVGDAERMALENDESVLSTLPYIGEDLEGLPISRVVDTGQERLQFITLAASLPAIKEEIAKMGTMSGSKPLIRIGVLQSGLPVPSVAAVPGIDLLLSGQEAGNRLLYPAVEEVDLLQNQTSSERNMPVIYVAPFAVVEVLVWLNDVGQLKRVRIIRHFLYQENPVASSKSESTWLQAGLPEQRWTRAALNEVFGTLLRDKAGADLAIFSRGGPITPIEAPLPLPLAIALLRDPQKAVVATFKGDELTRIFGMINDHVFSEDVAVVGANLSSLRIATRLIVDQESYKVVMTEDVWQLVHQILSLPTSIPSAAYARILQSIVKSRDKIDALNIVSSQRVARLNEWDFQRHQVSVLPSIEGLVDARLAEPFTESDMEKLRAESAGEFKPMLILNIAQLNIGLSGNIKNARGNYFANNLAIADPNLASTSYVSALIQLRVELSYLTQYIDSSLIPAIAFQQNNGLAVAPLTAQNPIEDGAAVTLQFRAPFERQAWANHTIWNYVTPVAKLTYLTRLWPIPFLTNVPSSQWGQDPYNWSPRPQFLNEFVGLNIVPPYVNGSIQFGGLLSYNCLQASQPMNAFNGGAELNGNIDWKWWYLQFVLEGSLQILYPFGTPTVNELDYAGYLQGKVALGHLGPLGIGLLANVYFGTQMIMPLSQPAVGGIFGITLSYSDYLKWVFE